MELVMESEAKPLSSCPAIDMQDRQSSGNIYPNKILHDLVTHKVNMQNKQGKNLLELEDKEYKDEAMQMVQMEAAREADISPKTICKERTKHIKKYKRRLGMHMAGANINGKIWYFVAQGVDVEVIEDKSQQITLNLKIQEPEY
ncbi:hypothetical protein KY290_031227 [Solanum tuberosum]|uniref:Uncharacterized protein n=1 Tax=Solanum tuberosum TaxID=4113 RepID=A0ABQ7U9D7_SOLTU|nr:hypothetical protein KY290_031227 [Solanum tuberosum]